MVIKEYAIGDLDDLDRIVLFGDSITQQSFTPELQGFGTRLANDYARKCDVINRGFSGYTTHQALGLLPRVFPRIDDRVKLVTVFFGANDAALPGTIQHVPIVRFKENLKCLLSYPFLRNKVLIMTCPPLDGYGHDPVFGHTRTAEVTKQYRDAAIEVAKDLSLPVADIWLHMMQSIGWSEEDVLPGSITIPKDEDLAACFEDGLHPSLKGYKLIYEALSNAIKQYFPSLDPGTMLWPTLYWPFAVSPVPGSVIRWHLRTSWTDTQFQQLLGALTKQERSTIAKFHFQKDRSLALGSLLLQKHFITSILGTEWCEIGDISRDSNNRPYFDRQKTRSHDYNISHHGTFVTLVAYVEGGRIGTDLTINEPPRETVMEFLSSFQSCFSTREWIAIDGDLARFYQHWALKESYVKAIGVGIVIDLTTIEFLNIKYVSPETTMITGAAELYIDNEPQNWDMELHWLADETVAAVCIERTDTIRAPLSEFVEVTLVQIMASAGLQI